MKFGKWVLAILFAATGAGSAFAQGELGRVSGIVRDQSNAFVADAKVLVKNERTGDERSALTNNDGYFIIGSLRPSTYTIKVEKGGFAVIEYTAMPVATGQELTLDFEVRPAGVQESVTVVGTSPVLDVSSARIGANVSEREVQGLPVNGRQMSQLLLQAPGSQNAGDGTWQDVRFSGRANEQNVIKYDGVEGSAIIDASPGNVNGENRTPFKLQASLENVQEFRVESSSYTAEFGTGTGGQVSVITKSGGNSFHGSVFEYLRNDALDTRNHFDAVRALDDSVTSLGPKSLLKLNQFGGSAGGPLVKDRLFFFGSYEGYRLDAGRNLVEAVPSAAAWARAVPAVAVLRPFFTGPGAVLLTGVSTNPDLDIYQLQETQKVKEDSFSARLDFKATQNWSAYFRVFHDQGTNDEPQGITGRRLDFTANPTNLVFNLQGLLGGTTINEFKVGYNAAPSTYGGVAPAGVAGILVSLGGTVANSGIAGQSGSTGLASPGQLVRVNSAGNGVSAPYDPYSLSFADSLSKVAGNHFLKFGGDVRLIRMSTDQLGGTTYTYSNLASFLSNTPQQVQFAGDLSAPSPFHTASGEKRIRQEYYVGFAQDEWRLRPNFTLNYGFRYDYYSPLREADNRIVKFNVDTGTLDPDTTPFYVSKKTSFQPRVGASFSPTSKTAIRAGVGIFVGPGQTEDQIQPIEAERVITTVTSGALNTFPTNTATILSNFVNTPSNRSYQPRAYANEYTLPEKVYEYTASVQQELGKGMAASVAYVGSQGRNLFLRSIANRTIDVQSNGTAAATQIREFDIVTRNADGTMATIQRPYAEIDYKTSGGHDSYNSMQLSLTRRSARGLTTNAQYTLGYSKGNTGGSNEAATVGNNARAIADFDYDNGYNNFDIRHTFNLSLLYTIPGNGAFTGGWSIGGIANARSGLPIPVLITRNDIVYVDAAGTVWNNAAADRTAVINTPGGGASRATRRPDLIPGVSPYIEDGGRIYLNPAAFATPKPGTFGNLERNSIKGPGFQQIDMVVAKRINFGNRGPNAELRLEVFNVFDQTNFANPPATLPNALPGAGESATQANRVQPGQPYTATSAGTFGVLNQTVGTTVGLGTNRQVQLAFRLNF
ncbi:MAG: carboxypeptidase regulatory-like domain-containing protein [Acidobacteriota bacterium]